MERSDFEGTWLGDNGAEIRLFQIGDAISGTYTAKAADRTVSRRGELLVGTADAAVIGFVTLCPAPHKIMSWIGRLVGSDNTDGHELHASCFTADKIFCDAEAMRHGAHDIVVFTKFSGEKSMMI